MPGVQSVALTSATPITSAMNPPQPVYIAGRPAAPEGQEPTAYFNVVSPRFFETMGVQLVRGRFIPDDIRPGSPAVVVVSESMARTLWPGEDAIGKRISSQSNGPWEEVIGIVRDVAFAADLGPVATRNRVYESLVRDPWGYTAIVLRADAPETLVEPLRRAVAEIDPDIPIDQLRTVERAVADSQSFFHLANQVLGGFAGLGLLLSAIGLYGVISGIVVRRTPEFGIRLALGARPSDVLWNVLGTGLKLSLIGVLIGLVGAFGVLRVLGLIAPSLPASDPLVIGAVSLLLMAVAAVACWIPARRATKLDPVIALRTE
jgi:predicted permease